MKCLECNNTGMIDTGKQKYISFPCEHCKYGRTLYREHYGWWEWVKLIITSVIK